MKCVVVTFSVLPTHSPVEKPGPAVRRPRRRMRPAVHEDRAVERPHELDVVDLHLARERILFLEDARAAEAAPLVRRRVRPALILRRAPDRLRRRVGAQASGLVERDAEVVAERRLTETAHHAGLLVVLQRPLARDVGWCQRARRLGQGGGRAQRPQQARGGQRDTLRGPESMSSRHISSGPSRRPAPPKAGQEDTALARRSHSLSVSRRGLARHRYGPSICRPDDTRAAVPSIKNMAGCLPREITLLTLPRFAGRPPAGVCTGCGDQRPGHLTP